MTKTLKFLIHYRLFVSFKICMYDTYLSSFIAYIILKSPLFGTSSCFVHPYEKEKIMIGSCIHLLLKIYYLSTKIYFYTCITTQKWVPCDKFVSNCSYHLTKLIRILVQNVLSFAVSCFVYTCVCVCVCILQIDSYTCVCVFCSF